MSRRIYLSPPHMCGRELEFVKKAFESNFIAPAGPDISAFEREMSEYLGGGHCVALSCGTAAIHLALRLSGVGPGDEVPCSDLSFIASTSPVLYQGANPVLIDSQRSSWNMDPELAAEYFSGAGEKGRVPKALILVHLYGSPADADPVIALCRASGTVLIEDAAEALGARYKDRMAGRLGRFGVLSFNGNKIITTSGGGMLVCRDKQDADQARFLATQARDPAPHYEHSTIGYNYRMSNICAAIGRGQLRALKERVEQKRRVFAEYRARLGEIEGIEFMPEPEYGRSNRWLSCLTFGPDREKGFAARERVRLALEAENIESRPVWKPMHMQPVFKGLRFVSREGVCVGEDLFLRGLCLPSGSDLGPDDLDRICGIIRSSLN